MFRGIFGAHSRPDVTGRLPVPLTFVDVAVMGRPAKSASVEEIGPRAIVLGGVLGRVGDSAAFSYSTPGGRYRFTSRITAVREGATVFDLPKRIEALSGTAQKRSSLRLDTLVAGQWRLAPGGAGVGEFMRGSVRDISRGGCALINDRMLKAGQMVEVRLDLQRSAVPLVALGEVVRSEQIPTSGKYSHGLRFHGLRPEDDQAILAFINKKLADLRSRGLA